MTSEPLESGAAGAPPAAGAARWNALREVMRRAREDEERPVAPVEDRVSYGQEQLLALFELFPESSTSYNMPRVHRLVGEVDPVALAGALDRLVVRHESLRTSFEDTAQGPRRRVAHNLPTGLLQVTDLRGEPAARLDEALELARDDAARPFDLARAPLLRARLIQLEHDVHVLVLVMHHLVGDGWSWAVVHRELSDSYSALATGCEGEQDPVRPYSDFVARQRSRVATGQGRSSLDHWVARLHDLPPAAALPDELEMSTPTFRGAGLPLPLGEALSGAVREACYRHRVTPATLLLAAFARTFQYAHGYTDVALAVPFANRIHQGMDDTVGYFVHTHAIRILVPEHQSVGALLAETDSRLAEAFLHQEVPPPVIEEELRKSGSGDQLALAFQALFVHLGQQKSQLELPGVEVSRESEFRTETTKNDLALLVHEEGEQFLCHLEYRADLYTSRSVGRLADTYMSVLREMVDTP
ncbi:condensation domain-containing protein [Streptomyces rubiginosohelvolus]|uniref:condensation domain-containing protein n=1 Tax=Streptomyces rubiginosohelvolus TaxID=67362 RepID=UPI003649D9DD